MASILFDDISFPRELYDPDSLEFVPPVSTLLAFTPHILSQLAKTVESEQEPIPLPSASVKDERSDNDKDRDTAAPQPETTSSSSSSSSSSLSTAKDFFSTFRTFASSQSTQRILENGIYLAGRYMDGSAAANASASSSRRRDSEAEGRDRHRYSTRGNSYWFGQHDSHRDQEWQRMKEMEERLRQMERDMSRNSAMARSEVDAQRRERYRLEQELESQRAKVIKLEREMEERQSQDAHRSKQEKEKSKKAEQTKRAKESKADEAEESEDEQSSEKTALLKKNANDHSLASNPAVLASVGVASLVMSMYAAHQASSTYSVVSFHDQLEVLMTQCQSVVQSTEAWISEQFLEVPDQIREDLKSIKELMETIQRLDPRSEKKAETVAWSVSAVGSLGAVGGAVLGSMTAMASGGTVVIGCALYGIISRARYNGPEYSAARTMMQLKAAQILKTLGVIPASSLPSSPSNSGRASLIHVGRIQKLRIEFEQREAHDMRDADEIDGLAVEEALRQSSFSAPFVSQKASARAARSRQQSATKETDDVRPTLKMKTESKRASAFAS